MEPPYIACLTAFEDNEFKEEALSSGMQAFINKPISREQLNGLLAEQDIILEVPQDRSASFS